MKISPKSKNFICRSTREGQQCYNAVLDPSPESAGCAYLRVEGNRESLLYLRSPQARPLALARDTYILSPCFAGNFLFWVEQNGGEWVMRAASRNDPGAALDPIPVSGRPFSLSSCSAPDGAWLAWEERFGKKTRIRMAKVRESGVESPVDITDGAFNAYEPACCAGRDNKTYVIYNAFYMGQYRILLQLVDLDGACQGPPFHVSGKGDACMYPSLWPRRGGGVWFSFTAFDSGNYPEQLSYVQHFRFNAQRDIFCKEGTVYAGLFENGKTYGMLAPPRPGLMQRPIAAMKAFGSQHGGHSQVFEDAHGRIHLVFRQHASIEPVVFEDQPEPLNNPEMAPQPGPANNYPAISMMSLEDRKWSEPVKIIPRAHQECPLSLRVHGESLDIAFTEDNRCTGWSRRSEWFDRKGEMGVGIATVHIRESTAPAYEFHPYGMPPHPVPRIEDPLIPRCVESGYMLAIGQTHKHSTISVCRREQDRDPHINYRFMQDVQHCDFGAITDHAYNMWDVERLTIRKLAEYYYVPGEFAAIPAYEWTGSGKEACGHENGPWGHVNPLYFEETSDLEFYTPCDPDCRGGSLPRLWQTYQGRRILTPPHHVADRIHPYNWRVFDPDFEPVIELFQDLRGAGEKPWGPGVTNFMRQEEGCWAVEELKKGKRFGFIAGGDHCGIARGGVWVNELTRSGIYEALKARRCFATTATPLSLMFECNGSLMGAEVETKQAAFSLKAVSSDAMRELQVVRDGEDVETVAVNGTEARHEWKAARRHSGEFWYCRIIFENGEIAWSSPIWLV